MSAIGIWVLGLLGCFGETIEVGARVDNARASGDLPPAADGPGILTGASLERLPELLAHAGFRNAQPEALDDVLDEWGVPAPIRDDLSVYMRTVRNEGIEATALGEHITAFILERHDPGGGLRGLTEGQVLALGMALSLGHETALTEKLVKDPSSRMLHCTHASGSGLLISSYAVAAVESLQTRGHTCIPVRVEQVP